MKLQKNFFEPIRNFKGVLTYTSSPGNTDVIESFIEYYKRYHIQFDKEDIIVTYGGTEALMFAMLATCDVGGDEIIVPEPLYTSYNGLASMTSVNIVPILTKAEDGFKLPDLDSITKLITEN